MWDKLLDETMKRTTAAELLSHTDGKYSLGDGLIYVVRGKSRTFVFRYQEDGRRHDKGLGRITLTAARKKAAKLMAWQSSGKKIADHGRREPTLQEEKTFGEVWGEAVTNYARIKAWRNPKSEAQWRASVERYALPPLSTLPVSQIALADILAVLKPIWWEKPETASRLRARLQAILDYCKVKGWRDGENPARWRGNLDALLPSTELIHPVKHHSACPWRSLPEVARDLLSVPGVGYSAILFGMLTAARAGEVCLARWEEIDLDRRIWSTPPPKGGRMASHFRSGSRFPPKRSCF